MANLIAGWQATSPLRGWRLTAAAVALADRVFTFSYFIPTMVRLMQAEDSAESVARATRWRNLNYVRHALVLVAWVSALKAFSLMYEQHT